MLVHATLLIQDVQLLCFTVIFGALALQRWDDPTRRWFWYSFLANSVGAVFDFFANHLPNWIASGINVQMIPLSYALVNIALMHFERLGRRVIWISSIILLATLPIFLVWSNDPSQIRSFALQDLVIALEVLVTIAILWRGNERSTRSPRLLMGSFLVIFAIIEFARVGIAFLLHADPDVFLNHRVEVASAVAYIVDTSLLPLAFIWMMNARLESDLLQQSIMDSLTRVLNRRGLEQALDRELARYKRYGYDLTVAMIDLDHFKQLNDTYGHAAGDAVLIGIANLLRGRVRETDVLARFGGEEFVLLLPHTGADESGPVLEHLCRAVSEHPFALRTGTIRASASFGATATRGRHPIQSEELLREADLALYRAKQNGRNQVRFYLPSDETAASPIHT